MSNAVRSMRVRCLNNLAATQLKVSHTINGMQCELASRQMLIKSV